MTPLMKMYTLGHGFVPPGIHAGGLRYHGMAPAISALVDSGHIEARAYQQNACFEAAHAVRTHRGHHPRAGDEPRHPRGD